MGKDNFLEPGTFGIFPAMVLRGRSPFIQTTYAWLWRYRNTTSGKAFPSLKRLCDDTGQSKPRLLKSIEELEQAGLLVVIRRDSPEAGDLCNEYAIPLKPVMVQGELWGESTPDTRGGVNPVDTNYKKKSSEEEECNPSKPRLPEQNKSGCELPSGGGLPSEAPRLMDVVRALAEAWQEKYGGAAHWSRITRATKQLLKLYPAEVIITGWAAYMGVTDARFASIEHFSSRAGVWCKQESTPAVAPSVSEKNLDSLLRGGK